MSTSVITITTPSVVVGVTDTVATVVVDNVGVQGAQGSAGTVAVGTTTTGAPGTSASVTNTGTPTAGVFNFTIPRGDTGAQGAQGTPGTAATIAAGTTTTGAAGSNASVTNSGTSSAAVFNFTIPRGGTGATGATGASGVVGVTAPITNTGTSTAAQIGINQSALSISNTQVSGLGTASTKDVAVSGNATTGQVVTGSDTRLTDSRTPTGAAGGDLTGTYPNPTLPVSGVNAGYYGASNAVPTFTVDSKGRMTSALNVAIQVTEAQVTGLTTDLAAKAPLASPTFTGTVTVPTPVNSTDAATKAYVDAAAQGLNVHPYVRCASTTNIVGTYTNGSADQSQGTGIGATFVFTSATIDGITLVSNDRVLLKNQSTATQNGIYYVSGTGTNITLTRATDADNHIAGQVVAGDFVFVDEGGQNNTGWVIDAAGTATTPSKGIRIGTDNISFTQFSGAGTYTAGTGLSLSGNQFANTGVLSVSAADTTVTVTSGQNPTVKVNPANLTGIPGTAISGNIAGNAANVTGTVAIGNGGTGATSASTALSNLGAVPTTRNISTTAPLTGGGTLASDLTLGISAGTTFAAGVVQLTDSTSSTSTTTAATPNSVKTAYDAANNLQTSAPNLLAYNMAIPNSNGTVTNDFSVVGTGCTISGSIGNQYLIVTPSGSATTAQISTWNGTNPLRVGVNPSGKYTVTVQAQAALSTARTVRVGVIEYTSGGLSIGTVWVATSTSVGTSGYTTLSGTYTPSGSTVSSVVVTVSVDNSSVGSGNLAAGEIYYLQRFGLFAGVGATWAAPRRINTGDVQFPQTAPGSGNNGVAGLGAVQVFSCPAGGVSSTGTVFQSTRASIISAVASTSAITYTLLQPLVPGSILTGTDTLTVTGFSNSVYNINSQTINAIGPANTVTPVTISNGTTSATGGVAYTTSSAHGFVAGDYVVIAGFTGTASVHNGTWQIGSTSTSTTFIINQDRNTTAVTTNVGTAQGYIKTLVVNLTGTAQTLETLTSATNVNIGHTGGTTVIWNVNHNQNRFIYVAALAATATKTTVLNPTVIATSTTQTQITWQLASNYSIAAGDYYAVLIG